MVEIVPPRVVEMVPVLVVDIVPVRVVEIVPALVVEIVPDFGKAVIDKNKTNTAEQIKHFIRMVSLLLVITLLIAAGSMYCLVSSIDRSKELN